MARKQEKDSEAHLTQQPMPSLDISAQEFVQIFASDVTFIEDMGALKKRATGI